MPRRPSLSAMSTGSDRGGGSNGNAASNGMQPMSIGDASSDHDYGDHYSEATNPSDCACGLPLISPATVQIRRRICVALSVALVALILLGPNGLSLSLHSDFDDGRLNRNDNPFQRSDGVGSGGKPRGTNKRNKKKRRKNHGNNKLSNQEKNGLLQDSHWQYSKLVDDDQLPRQSDYKPFSASRTSSTVQKKNKRLPQQAATTTQPNHPLPVYDYSADNVDTIPEGVGEDLAARPAYDALECRASVIDFVINATDIKDECEGLRKAFDKTCSVAPPQVEQVQVAQGPGVVAGPGGEMQPEEQEEPGVYRYRSRQRRRLLGTAELSYRDESWGGYVARHMNNVYRRTRSLVRGWYRRHFRYGSQLIHVDQEVAGEAWTEAKYQIDHSFEESAEYADRVQSLLAYNWPNPKEEQEWIRWAMDSGVQVPNSTDIQSMQYSRRLKAAAAEASQGELFGDDDQTPPEDVASAANPQQPPAGQAQAQAQPVAQAQAPLISPKLPTSSAHVGGQMLNDAVQLTNGGSNQAIATKLNATNGTASGVFAAVAAAAADAQQSAEAVSKATAAVSAVLNDPSSVEARTCCASILNVFHEHCDHPDADEITDSRLFIIVFVIAFCGMVKSLIRHFRIRWLPEAGGCILVGVIGGIIVQFFPHYDFFFDGDMFLRVMVPPIVFEAALSIDKSSFQRHAIPIVVYAVLGTLVSTFLTAFVVSKGSIFLNFIGMACPTIPFVESLTFGALISSIDPIAVLSVLNNMGMTDTDTIYVLIFGESLLNDGVAIVLFQTLVHFLDESLIIDGAAAWAATCHFVVVAVGSVMIGVISGACCTCYFNIMHGIQTPLVEVVMFLCWAFIPYYICDGVEWSGIVAIVAAGFVMDLYVVGQHAKSAGSSDATVSTGLGSNGSSKASYNRAVASRTDSTFGRIFTRDGHLSEKSKSHIHFVTEINATLMETAIFAYLGLFLFNSRYHWNWWLSFIAIFSCVASRAVMIPSLSLLANWLNGIPFVATLRSYTQLKGSQSSNGNAVAASDNRRGVFIDVKMQLVLWFAGLRGAMSFALVEGIPLFDTVTGQGSRMKPELKAMTSASIVFTLFVLGGYTYYLMERLGMSLNKDGDMGEIGAPLVGKGKRERKGSSCVRERKTAVDVSLAELGIGTETAAPNGTRQRSRRASPGR